LKFLLFLLWASWKIKQHNCLECLQKLGNFGICSGCLQRYQPLENKETGLIRFLKTAGKTQVPVFISTPWSQKMRKKWYRYKFLKAYAETALFVSLLLPTALLAMTSVKKTLQKPLEPRRIWLTHPPARAGKVYPWERIVQRLAAQQGWGYEPNLIRWASSQQGEKEQKTARSKLERQQQRATAFCATNNAKLLKKLKEEPPQLILLMDDIMTTGATISGCLVALNELCKQGGASVSLPQLQVVVLTEVPL
jgi:predicted amidophosphoribosyltransferase